MLFEKKEHLVTGRINPKTKEKIRLKLRFLLNRYAKCIVGISNEPDGRLRFRLEQAGYKALYYVYKSSKLENTQEYTEIFQTLYQNELLQDQQEFTTALDEEEKGPYFLFIAGRKSKRGY